METFKGTIFIAFLILKSVTSKDFPEVNQCGDWEPYKDESCLNIFKQENLVSYQEAEYYCNNQARRDAGLKERVRVYPLSINSEEKQNFIAYYLKSLQISDNVWLGLEYVDGSYQWSDGTELLYTNWAEGSPKNLTDRCVQIATDDGKWTDVLCTKKNVIACENIQLWNMTYTQTNIVKLQHGLNDSQSDIADLQDAVKDLQNSLTELSSMVTDVSKNPVPVGFIYVQLPNQQAPSEIWSWMVWEDVSSEYAGLFFRVNGGNSSDFGTVQSEDSPRFVKMGWGLLRKNNLKDIKQFVDVIANGEWSDNLEMLYTEGQAYPRINFNVVVSNAEVRPRNTAMKIWRRAK